LRAAHDRYRRTHTQSFDRYFDFGRARGADAQASLFGAPALSRRRRVNVARVAIRFGAGVELVYPTGGSSGHLCAAWSSARHSHLAVDSRRKRARTSPWFEEATGAEYRFVLRARASANASGETARILEQLHSRPKFMVASGSLPPDVPQDFYARVARIARKLGAKFVLDTSGARWKPR